MTSRLTANEVNSMDTDIYRVARLAYRLGRQDQQRLLERALRRRFDSDVQARTLADLAEGMTDDLVDFQSIVSAAIKDSTPVNSEETMEDAEVDMSMNYICPECEDSGTVSGARAALLKRAVLKCAVCAGDGGKDVFVMAFPPQHPTCPECRGDPGRGAS